MPKENTRQNEAYQLFLAALNLYANKDDKGVYVVHDARRIRQTLLADFQQRFTKADGETPITLGSAVSLYQNSKIQAVQKGIVAEFGAAARTQSGHTIRERIPGKEKGIPADVMQDLEDRIEDSDNPWLIVDKATNKVVDRAPSKKKAYERKTESQVVRKLETQA